MDINDHNVLRAEWKRNGKPCVLCGINAVEEKDHLPPKVLYPKALRTDSTYFYTFPTCSSCNRSSSDNDYLLSVYLSIYLWQEEISQGERAPTHPDHLALHEQFIEHLQSDSEGYHRAKLIEPYMIGEDAKGNGKIAYTDIPVYPSLIKFVKALYWFETKGDILENYAPGWWVFQDIDTSKTEYIDKMLTGTQSTMQWGDRFIAHYHIGRPENDVGGFVSCSLHFYTERETGNGANWHLIAQPTTVMHEGVSLFDHCKAELGNSDIEPRKTE